MKEKRSTIIAIVLAVITAGFTIAVKTIDVGMIGPQGTSVGFSRMNVAFANFIGVNYTWYRIAELLGLIVIGIFLVFAITGLVQLIKRKNLLKVDHNILVLGGMYLAVFGLYVLFEKVVVNYRPVIMPGEVMPEASFPSSHTMLAFVVIIGALFQLKYYIKKSSTRKIIAAELILIMLLTVFARVISGMHWLSDIIAGTLYSATLISIYCAVIAQVEKDNIKGRTEKYGKH